MRPQLVIGSGFVAKYPTGGGNYWVPLQYLRGFRDLGVDAYWLELLEGSGHEHVDRLFIDTFLEQAIGLEIADWTGSHSIHMAWSREGALGLRREPEDSPERPRPRQRRARLQLHA